VRIARINQEMPIGGIVEITLTDGKIIEGILRRNNVGNNAGQGGWQYYGECEIETKDNQRWVIDYLDIESARNAWSDEKAREYENLGLIKIVGN
jgi:hypothetical protein